VAIETADTTPVWTRGNRLVGYDPQLRRLWIGGQRLHHGATGVALAGLALAQIATRRTTAQRGVAYLLAGAALSAHDWHDRSVWFERGAQAKPKSPRA
jgi:hypothetical protein